MPYEDPIPEGYYSGTINNAWVEEGEEVSDSFVVFAVTLASERLGGEREVDCRHRLTSEKLQPICEKLGVAWPDGLVDIGETVAGKECRVAVFHNQKGDRVYVNAYLTAGRRRQKAEKDKVQSLVSRMKDGDGLPF